MYLRRSVNQRKHKQATACMAASLAALPLFFVPRGFELLLRPPEPLEANQTFKLGDLGRFSRVFDTRLCVMFINRRRSPETSLRDSCFPGGLMPKVKVSRQQQYPPGTPPCLGSNGTAPKAAATYSQLGRFLGLFFPLAASFPLAAVTSRARDPRRKCEPSESASPHARRGADK